MNLDELDADIVELLCCLPRYNEYRNEEVLKQKVFGNFSIKLRQIVERLGAKDVEYHFLGENYAGISFSPIKSPYFKERNLDEKLSLNVYGADEKIKGIIMAGFKERDCSSNELPKLKIGYRIKDDMYFYGEELETPEIYNAFDEFFDLSSI